MQPALKNSLVYGMVALAFGVAVPAAKGLGFLDPVLLSAYACLGVVFAGPAAAQRFQVQPRSQVEALKGIVKSALFGEVLALVMLGTGIGTVYVMHRLAFFPPDVETLGFAVLLGLAGSFALATLSAWVAMEFSPGAARMGNRLIFLALLVLLYLKGRWLPSILEVATIFCIAATGVFLVLVRHRLARA